MKNFGKIISILFVILLFVSAVSCVSKLSNSSESDSLFSGVTEFIESIISSDQNTDDYTDTNTEINTESSSTDVVFTKLKYVAFGDSITYGADYTLGYAQMSKPYPSLVADALSLSSVVNLGHNGATLCSNDHGLVCMTNNILAYTGDVDIISVMLCVNDYARSLPLGEADDKTTATIYGSLNLIAEHLTTTQEDAFIFFMTPYQCILASGSCTEKNSAGYNLEDVANAIKQVAADYNIPVLDMYNEGHFEIEMYNANSDGVHPSQEFVREYTAPQIAEFIRQNYRGK